jgi:hypothetical protein
MKKRCASCKHAAIIKKREQKGMPVVICQISNADGWDAVRDFGGRCNEFERRGK